MGDMDLDRPIVKDTQKGIPANPCVSEWVQEYRAAPSRPCPVRTDYFRCLFGHHGSGWQGKPKKAGGDRPCGKSAVRSCGIKGSGKGEGNDGREIQGIAGSGF